MNNIEKGKILLKQSLVYGLASSLQSVLGFLLLPILTQYYSTEEFGYEVYKEYRNSFCVRLI